MAFNLRNHSFVKEIDFSPRELRHLLELLSALKSARFAGTEVPRLSGKEIALIFEKTSTRTRSAFEVATFDQGAHVRYLDPSGSQLGHKDSIADTARVLGRMYDAIEYRGSRQVDVETLAGRAVMEQTGMSAGLESPTRSSSPTPAWCSTKPRTGSTPSRPTSWLPSAEGEPMRRTGAGRVEVAR